MFDMAANRSFNNPFSLNDIPDSVGRMDTMPPVALGGGLLGQIDQYELVRKLGGGGFGVVYLARDTVSGVQVAIKNLHPLLKTNAEEMERIRENFAVVQRLHHPHIAAALVLHPARVVAYADETVRRELHVEAGDPVLIMSYAPGVPLSKWRCQFPDRRVPLKKAVEICRQIALALDFAHSERIVHRDIKPSNIMVETREDGTFRTRVLDFGLAAEIRSSMSRVSREVGDTSGTRPYMAPEQWTGRRQDGRTDQYALAALFYELVSGGVPFAGVFETGDPAIMMTAVKTEIPEMLAELDEFANRALTRALAKEPENRFDSCTAFVEALPNPESIVFTNDLGHPPAPVTTITAKPVQHTPGEVQKVTLASGVDLDLVWCPAGSFMMGSPPTEIARDNDETQHRVTLTGSFWMGKYEVTQAQWEAMMGRSPSHFKEAKLFGTFGGRSLSSHPVEQVSWNDCQEFVRKVNARVPGGGFRLPTEAEWEYACRAGTTTAFHYGNDLDASMVNFDGYYPYGNGRKGEFRRKTTPVGSFKPNASGLYDMHGNVWEWCEDWYGAYPSGSVTDPVGPGSGSGRVDRGGCWYGNAWNCRSAFRGWRVPGYRNYGLGLRLARSPQ